MRRGEQHAAVDQYRGMIEAQANPLDQRRQMPGIDRLAVDRGLPADCVEAGAPGPGRSQRVRSERHIEAGDHAGGMFESAGERDRQARRGFLRVSEIRIGDLGKATFGLWYRLWRSSRLGAKYSSGHRHGEPRVISSD